MTTQEVSEWLGSIITHQGASLTRTLDKRTKKCSSWSKSFASNEGEELQTISNIFGLKITKQFVSLFKSATNGDGNERSKILTLHSSSLMAFLCFHNISEHPIIIDGIEYNEVMFEVKNDVIHTSLGKPSNIDILLLGNHKHNLLFLESKFTEYLTGGKVSLSPKRYEYFYQLLLAKKSFPFVASYVQVNHKPNKKHSAPFTTNEFCLNSGKQTHWYLSGIKQTFSHLLGIATGPAKVQAQENDSYSQELLDNATEIKYACIVFDCNHNKYRDYNTLYASVFENSEIIKESIREALIQRDINHDNILKKMKIMPKLLTYQKVFKDNYLPEKVRHFYSFVNDSTIDMLL